MGGFPRTGVPLVDILANIPSGVVNRVAAAVSGPGKGVVGTMQDIADPSAYLRQRNAAELQQNHPEEFQAVQDALAKGDNQAAQMAILKLGAKMAVAGEDTTALSGLAKAVSGIRKASVDPTAPTAPEQYIGAGVGGGETTAADASKTLGGILQNRGRAYEGVQKGNLAATQETVVVPKANAYIGQKGAQGAQEQATAGLRRNQAGVVGPKATAYEHAQEGTAAFGQARATTENQLRDARGNLLAAQTGQASRSPAGRNTGLTLPQILSLKARLAGGLLEGNPEGNAAIESQLKALDADEITLRASLGQSSPPTTAPAGTTGQPPAPPPAAPTAAPTPQTALTPAQQSAFDAADDGTEVTFRGRKYIKRQGVPVPVP